VICLKIKPAGGDGLFAVAYALLELADAIGTDKVKIVKTAALTSTRPWEAAGMSRSTWFRHKARQNGVRQNAVS
jgi:hypothetical protein